MDHRSPKICQVLADAWTRRVRAKLDDLYMRERVLYLRAASEFDRARERRLFDFM